MKLKWGGAGVALAAVVAAVAAALAGGGGGLTANLWVTDGTCDTTPTRQASPVAWSDAPAEAKACSFDQAWDAASAGDQIRVEAGVYGAQTITGDKASTTTITGAAVSSVTIGDLNTDGQNLRLEDVTVDVGTNHVEGWDPGASNITLSNVNIHGDFVRVIFAGVQNVQWLGGELGTPNTPGGLRSCGGGGAPNDPEPIVFTGTTTSDISIVGVNIAPGRTGNSTVCPPDGFHLEEVRIENGANNILIANSTFERDPDDGEGSGRSASIFITGFGGNDPHTITIANNLFEDGPGNESVVVGLNMDCTNMTVAYNTMLAGYGGVQCVSATNTRWIGNLGWRQGFGDCKGTYIRNVWQDSASITCGGTDTWVAGTRFQVDQLDINADGSLQATSPAIDAAETPGASDFCTATAGLDGLGSEDILGVARPVGSVCDAGAFEG